VRSCASIIAVHVCSIIIALPRFIATVDAIIWIESPDRFSAICDDSLTPVSHRDSQSLDI